MVSHHELGLDQPIGSDRESGCDRYIKGNRIKHISSKLFYTHELQNSGEINVQRIKSYDNLADLFTKALPTTIFKKLVQQIGMRQA